MKKASKKRIITIGVGCLNILIGMLIILEGLLRGYYGDEFGILEPRLSFILGGSVIVASIYHIVGSALFYPDYAKNVRFLSGYAIFCLLVLIINGICDVHIGSNIDKYQTIFQSKSHVVYGVRTLLSIGWYEISVGFFGLVASLYIFIATFCRAHKTADRILQILCLNVFRYNTDEISSTTRR